MKHLIEFFLKVGQVKNRKQRGLVLRKIKDPARIGGHSFREATMGWILAKAGKTGLDENRVIKLALCHDLVAGLAGDFTPYEPLIKKYKGKNLNEMYRKWVRLSTEEKIRFHTWQRTQERKTLFRLASHLPTDLRREWVALWKEYEEGSSPEGRFVQQLDMMENFLQSIEYWLEDKKFPIESWWQQMKELINDPLLVKLLISIDDILYAKAIKKK